MFIRRIIAALTGESVEPVNITPAIAEATAPAEAPAAQPAANPEPAPPPAAEFEFIAGAGSGPDQPANVTSPGGHLHGHFIPITAEQAAELRATAQRHAKLTAICTMIHVAHIHQSNLAEADACGVWKELLDRVRGNRPAETWQPTDADVELIYEGFRTWYRRNTRPLH